MKQTCSDFTCGNFRPGEAYDDERDCRQCWGAIHKASLAKALGRVQVAVNGVLDTGLPPPPPREPEPCDFLSGVLGPNERAARGLDYVRRWSLCLHPRKPLGEVVCPCQGCGPACPEYRDSETTLQWVSTQQLVADAIVLAGKLPRDVTDVVGIPRSGMLPAAVIATHLHLPLWQLTEAGLQRLGHGSRGGSLGSPAGNRFAVVDDTVYGGRAFTRARAAVPNSVLAAVYVRPEASHVADIFARRLPTPHLLEWNVANNGPMAGLAANPIYRRGIAFDLDGVIVHDAESGGPPGSPYLVPRAHQVKLIATGRRERSRGVTEALLQSLGVRWERLEMLPDHEPDEAIAEHKATMLLASGCGLFLESDPDQAEAICRQSGRPVICPRAGKVFQ